MSPTYLHPSSSFIHGDRIPRMSFTVLASVHPDPRTLFQLPLGKLQMAIERCAVEERQRAARESEARERRKRMNVLVREGVRQLRERREQVNHKAVHKAQVQEKYKAYVNYLHALQYRERMGSVPGATTKSSTVTMAEQSSMYSEGPLSIGDVDTTVFPQGLGQPRDLATELGFTHTRLDDRVDLETERFGENEHTADQVLLRRLRQHARHQLLGRARAAGVNVMDVMDPNVTPAAPSGCATYAVSDPNPATSTSVVGPGGRECGKVGREAAHAGHAHQGPSADSASRSSAAGTHHTPSLHTEGSRQTAAGGAGPGPGMGAAAAAVAARDAAALAYEQRQEARRQAVSKHHAEYRRFMVAPGAPRSTRHVLLAKRGPQITAMLEERRVTVPAMCACPHPADLPTHSDQWTNYCAENCMLRRRPKVFEHLVLQSLAGYGILVDPV